MHILLVEDDERARRWLTEALAREGLTVDTAGSVPDGLRRSRATRYDAIVLDVRLHGRSGLDLCRELRQEQPVPVIMVTALGELDDRLAGFDAGADDYVVKPVEPAELAARLRAVQRRSGGALATGQRVLAGDLVLEVDSGRAQIRDRDLGLSPNEFALLRALAEHAGTILSRDQLLSVAPALLDDPFDRSIDVRISRLRRKLGDDARQPRRLQTVRGVGYVLQAVREDVP
ncbi:MAG: response regulator transcription factor [Vicinamibacterales bacterium]